MCDFARIQCVDSQPSGDEEWPNRREASEKRNIPGKEYKIFH